MSDDASSASKRTAQLASVCGKNLCVEFFETRSRGGRSLVSQISSPVGQAIVGETVTYDYWIPLKDVTLLRVFRNKKDAENYVKERDSKLQSHSDQKDR